MRPSLVELQEHALERQSRDLEQFGHVDGLLLIVIGETLEIRRCVLLTREGKLALFDRIASIAEKDRPDAIVWCAEVTTIEIPNDRLRHAGPAEREALYRMSSQWLLEHGYAKVGEALVATAQNRLTYCEVRAPFTRHDGQIVWGERVHRILSQSALPVEQNASRFFREDPDDGSGQLH